MNNKNLLIIGYCHLDDGFLYGAKALERLNYNISFFPYLSHVMDNDEERDNKILDMINKNNINICLWWNNSVKYENYKKIIINKEVKHYLFNWDPFLYNYAKYNCYDWKERIDEKELCYPLMSHVFSCFEEEINFFKNKIPITYTPPGFDPEVSYFDYDKDYECDVSIVCTNFYNNLSEFPDDSTNITRYEIVDKLYQNKSKINFHIYGPENFRNIYPECYKGFIRYKDCRKVFSNSKINLSIHPMVKELNGRNSKEEYFSERVPQILGCKGLCITNSHFSDKLIENEDYIYIDKHFDWFEIFISIIQNNNKYDSVRYSGFGKAMMYYKWDNWAKILDRVMM
jgi:hypothetical protein